MRKYFHHTTMGIIVGHDLAFTASGTVTFGTNLVDDDSASFTFAYDGGIQAGDYISISGQSNDRSNRVDHRKVHVARRRQSKGKTKAVFYEVESATATTLTLKDTDNGIYQVTTGA